MPVLVWLLLFCYAEASDIDLDREMRLTVLHSFDSGLNWIPRGSLSLQGLRSANAVINQDELSSEEVDKLKDLCSSNKLYLIKILGEAGVGEHRTYVSACQLLRSHFTDSFTLHIDWRGNLAAVHLGNSEPEPPLLLNLDGGSGPRSFKTRVVTQVMENGPTPDTAAFIQKVEEEKARKLSGEPADNRSFLAKYWMYIVPVVIFLAINSAAGPEAGR